MRNEPIAIVGVSAIFPGSKDEAGFWRDIVAGRDLITDVPERRWLIQDHYDPDPRAEDKTYCKRGAFLSPSSFDPLEFGVPPNAIPATDTCQLLSLLAAKRVLEDVARGQPGEVDRERASVILGVTSGQQLFLDVTSRLRRPVWVKALRECGITEDQVGEICDRISASYVPWQENTFPGLLGNVVAGRIANRFDLHGTNCVTDAACASSLAAVSMAVDELRLNRSDLVITGGADTFNDVSMFVAFSKTPALSPTGDCRPFSDRADGTVLGEGIALFALKRLSDAERDQNRIYAVIRSIGSSSDGRSKSIYAPLPTGQARAMARAYEEAGYGPETVELVEAHGTGTAAGDAAEIESLNLVFEPAANGRRGWCALGSVKSQVGHTKAAAGAAALFKTAMALHHQTLPPTIKVERPNPALKLGESPFYLNTAARPWVPQTGRGRRAALSSFGFGGTNFHVVLEEYAGSNPQPKRVWPAGPELVLVSAPSAEALRRSCLDTAKLCDEESAPFANIALASQYAFDAKQPHRAAVVASDRAEMARKLRHLADGKSAPATYTGSGSGPGKIAFLFPGQGSQYLNMGLDLVTTFPEAMAVWEKAPEAAAAAFPSAAFSPSEEEEQNKRLKSTETAQPAIGAASAALLAVLDSLGVRPDCVGGHSFGEITAMYAAGSITLDDMLSAAHRRGELMRKASTEPAGMMSVRAGWEQIRELLNGIDVTAANHNGPAQVVLAGASAPLRDAEQRLRAAGLSVTVLPVSTAFHSPLMATAAAAFRDHVQQTPIATPSVPFYSNRDGGLHDPEGQAIGDALADQIASPVFFGEMVERMYEDGVRTFVEVGPRDVLTSLVGSILEGRPHQAIALDRPAHSGLRSLFEGLGALAASGVAMDWKSFRGRHDVSADLTRPKEPAFSVPIDGGNYGRPYPPPGGAAALPKPVTAPPRPAAPAPSPAIAQAPVAAQPRTDATEAYRVFQESITAAHRDWQTNLAQGHEAFLRSMESAFASAGGNTVAPSIPIPATVPALPAVSAPAPVQETKPPAPRSSSAAVIWEVIAEKTGYPADMLEPAMALEADLGIDSIKRVEIFSALQDSFPALAAMDPSSLVTLRTLGDIVTAIDGAEPPPSAPATVRASSQSTVWTVVAEKTGYPGDMLEPAMALEADLGIDSIKRVEIFSALQDSFPALAAMDPASLVTLQTLGDIVTAIDGAAPPSAPAAARASSKSTVWAVVAEKTGYPGDMLEPAMALEADLGIDSIKRVEIFSALQDSFPALAAMDPSSLVTLRTLGDIVTAIDGAAPPSAPVAARESSKSIVWAVVAEKTGYPADMLEPAMALEADLGIDSIKRVEIFSALQDSFPALAAMDPASLVTLRTLGDIVTAIDGAAPDSALETVRESSKSTVWAVVAEKTGYPADMLEPAMALEADLGIDSIKRVEIFSALQEQFPALAAVDPASLTTLRTLGDIVATLDGSVPSPAPVRDLSGLPKRYVVGSRPAAATAHSMLQPGDHIVVSDDGRGIAGALSALLSERGFRASVGEGPANANAWICLDGLRQVTDNFQDIHWEALRFAKLAAGRTFITVQEAGQCWAGGFSGLAKTFALEWPGSRAKSIRIQAGAREPEVIARTILTELLSGGSELEIELYEDGSRRSPVVLETSWDSQSHAPALPANPVLIATGGARGVTAACLKELAGTLRPRLVLFGRTALADEPAGTRACPDAAAILKALPEIFRAERSKSSPAALRARASEILAVREVRQTIEELERAGAEVRYVAVDARDAKAVGVALDEIRREWGAIHGLIHAAGVLADKLIADLTPQQFESVFSTKAKALRVLLDATAGDSLSLICLFSSVAARYGNRGQAAYSMANELLNRVAEAESRRRGPACIVRSINWGPWQSGMVTPALAKHFAEMNVPLIGLEEGARAFVQEILNGSGNVEVVIGGPDPTPLQELQVHIRNATHPHLNDHRIQDVPVLPLVEAVGLLLRGAAAQGRIPEPPCATDVKVLRGVRLEQFHNGGNRFTVRPCGDTNFELVASDGSRHYEASLLAVNDSPVPPPDPGPLSAAPWPQSDIYGKLLFHGPEFHMIHGIEGVSESGIAGTLRARNGQSWRHGTGGYDPGMLDGGLQLARLWGFLKLGQATLPMRVGCIRILRDAGETPVECRISASAGSNRIVCDISFYSRDKELLALMTGVEMYAAAGA